MTKCPDPDFWGGKKVLVTGHTGFKGSWLSVMLHALGAEVTGISLSPNTDPSLYYLADVRGSLQSEYVLDIRHRTDLRLALLEVQPAVVFHLAAQPLVRESYVDPLGTLSTNILGTANLLDAIRECGSVKEVISVTSDKVYRNREWVYPYRESDMLGGRDPYSASKACAEHVTYSFASSYLAELGVSVATARAGNVIGGGDWSHERLIPDVVRALAKGHPLELRNPVASRPWQHVLDCNLGYLLLAEYLSEPAAQRVPMTTWNFGPATEDAVTTAQLVRMLTSALRADVSVTHSSRSPFPEAMQLQLDSSKARRLLGWEPRFTLQRAIEVTGTWYSAWLNGADMTDMTRRQVTSFLQIESVP